jgi:hypothetical protein
MTDNPLKVVETKKVKRTAQEWCDIGNDRLAGRIPYSDGEYRPRNDIKWYVENGSPKLRFKY